MKKISKIFTLLLISLFLITILINVVSAQTAEDKIKSFFSNINKQTSGLSNDVKTGIAKILLTILIILLVYSIISFIPIINTNPGIGGLISVIVGILSFIFVKPEDILGILVTYEAMGVILTTFFPLVIIIIFTVRLREANAVMATFVNKMIIAGFAVYVAVKWFTLPVNAVMTWVYPITLIVSIMWLFLERWIYWKIIGSALSGNTEEFKKQTIVLNEMKIRELQEKLDKAVTEKEREELQKRIDQLKKNNKKLKKS
ncbi:MAG: hypothetical protein QW117_00130 [Candidatus Pacearchaeota archaeon]